MFIHRWFQGRAVCGGHRPDMGSGEPGEIMSHCLFTQATYNKMDHVEIRRLADIIERHFSARTTCQHCQFSPTMRLIHFNNHELTMREDIDKVLRIYTEEAERA